MTGIQISVFDIGGIEGELMRQHDIAARIREKRARIDAALSALMNRPGRIRAVKPAAPAEDCEFPEEEIQEFPEDEIQEFPEE